MPNRPPHYCNTPGCGNLTHNRFCKEHAAQKEKERQAKETWRDYNSPEWKYNRATVLRLEPSCRVCNSKATVVDHIKPLKQGGTHKLDNLQALCKTCHDRKTWKENLKK